MSENQLPPTFHVIEDPGPSYYSSAVRIISNIYGFSFLFGQARPVGLTGDAVKLEPVCTVHMSPAHAKSIYLILRQQIRSYEQQWGEIPSPPDVAERFGEEPDGD